MATTNTNAGAVTDSGTLTVTGIPPTLILPPSDEMTVAEGADVSINCKVDGLPRPWHRWLNVSILGGKIQTLTIKRFFRLKIQIMKLIFLKTDFYFLYNF